MSTRIEAAKLTDEEILAMPAVRFDGWATPVRIVADAATAKALQVQDANLRALVEAAQRLWGQRVGPLALPLEQARAWMQLGAALAPFEEMKP